MNMINEQFRHRHAAHCESGVAAALMSHHGAAISEAMAFGLSSALSFAYLPFVKLTGFPLIAYRMPPRFILRGMAKPFRTRFRFETFRDPAAGMRRLDELLAQGKVVGLQTSVFWLPYFPEDMRFHFNAHNLLVYGKQGDEYLISDPVAEEPQRCAAADLQRARFAKGVLAPKGLLYYPETVGNTEVTPDAVRKAIRKTARIMLGPIPLVGVRGMRMLAGKVARLKPDEYGLNYVGHIVRMQEEIGTGGAGFRFLYASFLQEAADIAGLPELRALAERMNEIGDGWRAFGLKAVRMIKGREAFDPALLAGMLRGQAENEAEFFRALKRAVA
ncbi:MAG: BtrH N-terminal domain-containing protein [Nitrosomonadales bacterium]|nr:BtrH N-terminal domain-containing protein [Nitrosomonadales bacterium]